MLGDILHDLSLNELSTRSATYDFDLDGGAIGTIKLPLALPAGTLITKLVTSVSDPLTSGGLATVAIEAGATVVKAAIAFDDASYVGTKDQGITNPVVVSADGFLEVVIAVAPLTAGTMKIILSYL
jgi:hypothetical protein